MNDRPSDTRQLLKVFGVAVTLFEDQTREVLDRLEEAGPAGGDEALPAVREVLERLTDTNEKWLAVTDHLFSRQREVLGRLSERLESPAD